MFINFHTMFLMLKIKKSSALKSIGSPVFEPEPKSQDVKTVRSFAELVLEIVSQECWSRQNPQFSCTFNFSWFWKGNKEMAKNLKFHITPRSWWSNVWQLVMSLKQLLKREVPLLRLVMSWLKHCRAARNSSFKATCAVSSVHFTV